MSHPKPEVTLNPLNFKVILLGDSNVGKTCFIHQFIDNQFPLYSKATVTVDFVAKTYKIDDFSVRLNIFDTAGQERYRAFTKAYFKGADAVLFMYSMDSKESFENVKNWIQYFEEEAEARDAVRVLVGTKKDLIPDVSSSQAKEQSQMIAQPQKILKSQIKQLVQSKHFLFKFETSAKTNLNINIVFQQLSRNLICNSIQRRRSSNKILQSQWGPILKRDKEHLLRESEKDQCYC